MSFVSSTNTLTLGNSSNTTINIGTTSTNPTINIGVTGDDNPVLIRGLDPLITSTTDLFAFYRAFTDTFSIDENSYYYLPFSTTQNILIQWGYVPDLPTTTIIFEKPYISTPYAYVTNFIGGTGGPARINAITNVNITIDSNVGDTNKAPYNWLAIGLCNK
jgi:hypothetical protein